MSYEISFREPLIGKDVAREFLHTSAAARGKKWSSRVQPTRFPPTDCPDTKKMYKSHRINKKIWTTLLGLYTMSRDLRQASCVHTVWGKFLVVKVKWYRVYSYDKINSKKVTTREQVKYTYMLRKVDTSFKKDRNKIK